MSELLATLEAPVYIERVALGDNRQVVHAARAIRRALENQVRGLGFSLVEILSPCPTIWKMSPVEAQRWVRDEMEKVFPPCVLRDRTPTAQPRPDPRPAPPLDAIPRLLGIASADHKAHYGHTPAVPLDLQVRVAGFGGQGVLLVGEILAEAGLDAGLEVSWLPSYGPEMRSGTSNCHIRLAREPIDSPLVSHPDILVAMNEPSFRKFSSSVRPGGWILYNGAEPPPDCDRSDVHVLARPFTQIAHDIGDQRVANMVMLGALLEIAGALPQTSVEVALGRLVKSPHWLSLDERALICGREMLRESRQEVAP